MTVKITITWGLNVFINYFTLTLPASQKQFCQVVRIGPVHTLKVLKFLSGVSCHQSYSKFVLILLQREEFAAKSNVSRKMFFVSA